MDIRAWERCADARMQMSDFAGERCWIGLDLAQKKDFAAVCLVFERGGVWHVFSRLYLNELAVEESGNAHLSGWARSGHVQVTDGAITDFDVVADDLRAYCRQFDVQEIAFDPALSVEESVTIALQVSGKLRGQVVLPRGTSREEALAAAERQEAVAKWLEGKERVKVVFVPDRLLNVVVK